MYYVLAFQREHDQDGEQQGDQGHGADFREQVAAFDPDKHNQKNPQGKKAV